VTWRELAITLSVLLAYDLLSACYAEHDAAPCDASLAASEKGSVVASFKPGSPKDPQAETPVEAVRDDQQETYPGPCPFKYDAVHCYCTDATHEVCDGRYCEGPYVGCIAPNSPMSSTWVQR
jgi:hypothetical protein